MTIDKNATTDAERSDAVHTSPRIAVVSANFGGIDGLSAFATDGSYDGFYYTEDHLALSVSDKDKSKWPNVIAPKFPRRDFSPRLRAKYFKLQIHRLEECKNYEYLCWLDARISIKDTSFLSNAIKTLDQRPANERVLIFRNPFRSTVIEEYEFLEKCISEGNERITAQYGQENMAELIAYYRSKNWNLEATLPAAGFWIRQNNSILNQCWDTWWEHNLLYTIMDQLSLPVIMDNYDIVPQFIPGNIYKNNIIELKPHLKIM